MRQFIYILLCFFFVNVKAQKRLDIVLQDQGHARDAIVSIPTKPMPAGGYPVVVMLHGTSGDSEVFYSAKGWKELGQEENFITVFPSALKWCYVEEGVRKNFSKFVNGDLLEKICPEQKDDLIDDVAFIKRIVKLLGDTIKINPKKIFASGFSNGDVMINKLAMDAGDVFAAVGGSSGALHELDSLTPAKRIPIWYMVGTADDRFLVPPYQAIPYGGDSSILYLKKFLNRFLVCQGLTNTYRIVESPINKTFVYDKCVSGQSCAPFLFTINKNQTHEFPNGLNYPFDAPKFLWAFFNNNLTSSINEQNVTSLKNAKCYPNPASLSSIIDPQWRQANAWSLQVIDLIGHTAMEVHDINTPEYEMSTSHLMSGVYVILVKSREGLKSVKLIIR
jgi:polyhydroxybutyrate depolymerase